MKFDFGEHPFWLRVIKGRKGQFIFFAITIVLDLLFTGTVYSIAVFGFIWLVYSLFLSSIRDNKFYIQKFIMDENTLRMKVYRFASVVLDTDTVFELSQIKIQNTPSNLSVVQKDHTLIIELPDLKIRQLDSNGWTNEIFDEIISYLNALLLRQNT